MDEEERQDQAEETEDREEEAAEAPAEAPAEPNLGPGPSHDRYHLPGQAQGPAQGEEHVPPPGAVYGSQEAAGPPEEAGEAPEEAEADSAGAEEPRRALGWLSRAGGLIREAGRGWKGLVAAGLALFCLGALSAGLLMPRVEPEQAAAPPKKPSLEAEKLTRALEPFIFVGSSGGQETIFKVGLAVEFANQGALRRFEVSLDAARGDIYNFLSRQVEEKSLSTQKSELQEAVRDLLNARFGPGQVVRVYFSEFLAV